MLPAMNRRLLACSLLLLPLACKTGGTDGGGGGDGGETTPPKVEPKPREPLVLNADSELGQTIMAQLDQSTDPCDDFYQFACGGWIANTPLPDDKPRWSRGFGELADRNNEVLRTILEKDEGRAGRYYAACMDTAAINAAGTKPLAPYLKKIDKLKPGNQKALFKLLGEFDAGVGLGAFFSFGLSIDFEKPDLHITDLGEGGTGLPDRSYYLDPDKKEQVLPFYQAHVARMLGFLGYSEKEAAEAAERVVALETKLAELQKPPEDMRDPKAVYNRWDREGVEKSSNLPWGEYFKALGAPDVQLINVSNPDFISGLPAVLAAADAQSVKDYLRFHLLGSTANLLSDDVVNANFEFAAALTGQKQLPDRWERCVAATNAAAGDLVSQGFVEQTFAGDSKDLASDMIKRVEGAFEAGLPALEWMDPATREAAVGKMKKVENKIGYPEKWRTYDGMKFKGNYFSDTVASRKWFNDFALAKVGKAVDEKEWSWPASIVNAGYNPLQNEMLFPAGILQPPFFSRDYTKAMNFGAIGMVVGHELTHGFDDSGRQFDGDGVMREWWAPAVSARYDKQTQCIVDTYSALEVQPGAKLNGKLTLGENIADFGGIKESFNAYEAWLAEGDGERSPVDGLSNEQLFFVAYAQSWCTVSSPEIDKLMATVDPHSPPKFRVNVPLSHFSGFWTAFSCDADTAMHADQVCEVW